MRSSQSAEAALEQAANRKYELDEKKAKLEKEIAAGEAHDHEDGDEGECVTSSSVCPDGSRREGDFGFKVLKPSSGASEAIQETTPTRITRSEGDFGYEGPHIQAPVPAKEPTLSRAVWT